MGSVFVNQRVWAGCTCPQYNGLMQFASAKIERLLVRNGLADLESVLQHVANVPERHRGRTVWSTQLTSETGAPIQLYVKAQWLRQRFWPRPSEIFSVQAWQSHPELEWHGLQQIEALGLSVPRRWALFRGGRCSSRAAIVLEAVPPKKSMFDLMADGTWLDLPRGDRPLLLDQCLGILDSIHRAGLGWRGASTKHIFPEQLGDGQWKLWLIDCEGVHSGSTRRTQARDHSRFLKSFSHCCRDTTTTQYVEHRLRQLACH